MMSNGRNKFPFTPCQWQELEHQALIFKYMVSGMPIPSDLLFTIKRSLDSSLSSKLILQPQHVGWNCFQMGFGRKIDPEPGRCRRTDGKKWRCSKEAYPDSKYCERHMHRGRNRSRKPVETNTSTPPPPSVTTKNTNPSSSSSSSNSHILSPLSSSVVTSDTHHHNHPCYSSTPLHHPPFLYPHSSSSPRPPGIGLSSQDNNTHFLLESGPYSHSDKDYRNSYGDGMKEEVDEHAFFQESYGSMRSMSGSGSDSWPLTMSHHKHRNGYSYLQLQDSSKQQQNQDQQHYYIPLKSERSENHEHGDEPQKVIHHFFDEWPPKNKDSWLDSADKLSNHVPISTTQLSISIPTSSHHDFFMTTHTDK